MKIQTLKLSDLIVSEYNPRKATKEQEEVLSDSLRKFGCVEPIIYGRAIYRLFSVL
jgi:ParB-like chromosome segregation protein Spo0J